LFKQGQLLRARVAQPARSASDRMLVLLDLDAVAAEGKAARKAAAAAGTGTGNASFIDPSITRLADLQSGVLLRCKLRAIVGGEGLSARVELLLGSVGGKDITARVHPSQLEDPLHARVAAGDKAAKALVKAGAAKGYDPLGQWKARVEAGEEVQARILQVVRKETKSKAPAAAAAAGGKKAKSKKHIASIDASLRPSVLSAPAGEVAKAAGSDVTALAEGQVVQVYVKDIEATVAGGAGEATIWAVVAPGIKARLRCNELSFPSTDAASQKALKNLSSTFKPGQALTAQIVSLHAEKHLVDVALLPLGATKARVLDPALVAKVNKASASMHGAHGHELRTGALVHNVTVKRILPHTGLIVSFHPGSGKEHKDAAAAAAAAAGQHEKIGRIHITDLADRWTANPLDSFSVGQKLPAAVVLSISAREAKKDDEDEEMDESEEGDAKPKKAHQQVDLSLRPSRLAAAGAGGAAAVAQVKKASKSLLPEVTDLDSLVGKEGSYVQGYVKSTSKAGCFIALSHAIDARCLLKNLSDSFVADVGRAFPAGKLLSRVRIVSVDAEKRTVEVSLRKTDGAKGSPASAGGDNVGPDGAPLYTFESVSVGDVVRGVVTQVKPFGVFIKLAQSSLSGLAHISECSDARIADLAAHYEAGDKVRAKVVKKDDAARKISLGLKAKYFEGLPPVSDDEEEDEEEDEDAEEEEEDMQIPEDEEDDEEEAPAPAAKKAKAAKASPAAAPAAAASSSIVPPLPGAGDDDTEMAAAPALSLDLGASLALLTSGAAAAKDAADSDASDDEEEDGDDDEDGKARKSRRAKAGAKKAAERSLRAKELSQLDTDAQPESAEDYERLLVQDPNSSMVWIKYMAFQISLTEIDAARALAERALKAISFRNAQDKLNVWVALLNLENMYGTQSSLKAVLDRALQYNDPLTVTMEMAKIYAATNKTEQCIATYEGALKKFHGLPSIWLAYGSYLYTQPGRVSEARDLLKRALSRCDKADHISLITRWASLEFHVANNVDRGRTLLEGVLAQYPKRVDLWQVYVDMELKLAKRLAEAHAQTGVATKADGSALNHDAVRRLFERITNLTLSSKKMKFQFQRWLAFEKNQAGADPQRIEHIKNKARQFVATKAKEDGDE